MRDFILPLNSARAGDAVLSDWYQTHTRLGESFGKRFENDRTRYLYCDEPTIPVRGAALRIRAIDRTIGDRLKQMGLPSPDLPDPHHEGKIRLALTVSGKSKLDPRPTIAGHIVRLLEISGLSDIGLLEKPTIRPYKIRKAKVTSYSPERLFEVHGIKAHVSARISDPDLFAAALETGIGRDKGFGFGIITLLEDI